LSGEIRSGPANRGACPTEAPGGPERVRKPESPATGQKACPHAA